MLDRILIGSSAEPSDPNFENVTLLLHGDGSNGAQNNTFIDSSTNNFTITRNGNTTQGSFSPYGSNWSNYFDGNDHLTVGSNTALALGSGDFTVECWINPSSVSVSQNIILDWRTSNNNNLVWYLENAKNVWRINTASQLYAGTISANTWTHMAVVRSGGTTTLYINGTSTASFSDSTNYSIDELRVGKAWDSNYWNGYLSNVRIVKGTAVYTSNFTPPTAPLTAITNTSLLTCADNRFRDSSTNNFAITRNGDVKVTNFAPFAPSSSYSTSANGGSAYFDGSGDYLVTPSSTALTLASGDFTIEAWVYPTALNASQTIVDFRTSGSDGSGFFFGAANTTQLQVYAQGSINIIGGTLTNGQWQHVACVRSGSTVTLYINGVSVASGSNSTNWTRDLANIGAAVNTVRDQWNGFVSNLRIVKGTAVYTAAFTPPSSPVTAITNTSLLLNATNAAIFDNSMKNDLETVGNAQISTSVKKFGTGSMYFDGSGDYLSIPPTQEFSYGSGSFTVELWFYASSVSGSEIPIYKQHNSGAAAGDTVEIRIASSKVVGYIENTSFGGSTTLSANTWYHVAYVRNGSTCTLYLNGVSEGSASNSANLSTPTTVRVGTNQVASSFYTGYVDDVRVSKGIARYTANFTAPTAPFPNK